MLEYQWDHFVLKTTLSAISEELELLKEGVSYMQMRGEPRIIRAFEINV